MTAGAKDTAQSLARGDEAEIARLEKMARAMIARDELSAACGALRELCVLAPQRVSAREMLVSALVRRGNFSEAREIADEAAMLGLSSPRLSQLRADLEAMAQSPDATLQGWHADDPYDSSVELVEASAVYEEVSSADADSTIHELRSGARENDSVANMLLGPAARVDESEPTWTASFDVEAEAEPRAVGRAKVPYNAGGRLGRIIAWSLLLALLGAGGLGAYYYLEQRDVGESTLKKAARAARSLEPSGIKAAIAGIDAVKLSFGAQRDRLRAQRMLLVALAELSSGAQLSRMQDNIDADADAEARATKRVAQAVRAIIEGQSPGDVEQRLAKAKSKQHGALISALGAWQAWLRGRSKAARAAVKQALGEDGKSGLALLLRGHLAADAGDVEAARESYAQLVSLYPQHELGSWSQAALALLDPAARVVVSDAKRVKATTPLARGLEKVLAAFAAGKRDAAALAATRRALQQLSGNLRAHRVLVAALGRALVASCAFATAHEMAKRLPKGDAARDAIELARAVARGEDVPALALASERDARLRRWVMARSGIVSLPSSDKPDAKKVGGKKTAATKKAANKKRAAKKAAAKKALAKRKATKQAKAADVLTWARRAYALAAGGGRGGRKTRARRLAAALKRASEGASAPLLAELSIVRALAAGDDGDKAKAALGQARALCPGNARVALLSSLAATTGAAADDDKQRAAAQKKLEKALAAGARHPRATLSRVRQLLAARELEKAQKLMDGVSKRAPEARLAHAELALFEGDASGALRLLRRAGRGSDAGLLAVRALLLLDRPDAAAKRLKRLPRDLLQKRFDVALLSAEVHAQRGDAKELAAELERAKALPGADAAQLEVLAPMLAARALLAKSRRRPRKKLLRRVAKLAAAATKSAAAPGRAYRLLGETLAALDQVVAARAAFDRAVKLSPKDPLAHFGLAEVAARGKRPDDKTVARDAYKRFLELSSRRDRARRKTARRALRQL